MATVILQTPNYGFVKLKILRDQLLVRNEDLRKINEELDPLIPADDIEMNYASIAQYDDQAVTALSELNCQIA